MIRIYVKVGLSPPSVTVDSPLMSKKQHNLLAEFNLHSLKQFSTYNKEF